MDGKRRHELCTGTALIIIVTLLSPHLLGLFVHKVLGFLEDALLLVFLVRISYPDTM